MKETRNKLQNAEWGINWQEEKNRIGSHLRRMRERNKMTQSNVGNAIQNASERTYQNMERGDVNAKFASFIEVFRLFGGTDRDAAILFGNRDSEDYVDDANDPSPAHLARLNKFTNQKYTIFYYDMMDKMKQMKISFGDIVEDSYVQGTAKINDKYTYDCKLISPANSHYVFLYLTSTTALIDRAFMMLPEIEQVVCKFKRGIGVMMSISIDNKLCPTTQKFIMLNNIYKIPDKKELATYLELGNAKSDYMLRFPDLRDANDSFVKRLILEKKKIYSKE